MPKSLGLAAAALVVTGVMTTPITPLTSAAGAVTDPVSARGSDGRTTAREAIDRARDGLAGHPVAARDTAAQAFVVRDVSVDPDGTTHVRMERTFRGLRVVGGDLVVHQGPRAAWEGVSQTLNAPLELSTRPVLDAAASRSAALSPAAATRDLSLRANRGTAPELVVDAIAGTPRLAWAVTTAGRASDGTPSRLTSYVDARSGRVLDRVDAIHTADGEGNSLYSGTVPISVQQSGSAYRLTDVAHGNAATSDMQNKEDSPLCTLFGSGCTNGVVISGSDTVFGTGTAASRESAAVDAHYGGAVTFDYYRNVQGRAGIFGNGTGAPSRVHYGNGYVNAFWDGEKMTYGDGDGSSFGPLVSLDVAGHEMSHGVTENTANLTYSGESGGLNEATSDIFGTMVEFYAGNAADPGDYYIGEEFDLASGQGFRRMDDPALDGSSYSCYTAGIGNADVHYSSGVANHFFYLLAEGSGAKTIGGRAHNSPTCNGSSVTGIGRSAAERIWFRALTTYFTSGTTYAQARTGSLNAASDLFGAGSTQYATVAAAWSAVNVG